MKKPLVMITGAGTGIGAATAKLFAEAGHPLLLLGRRRAKLEELNLPRALCLGVDVRERAEIAAAVTEAEREHGPIDCLINNAGIAPLARIEDQDPAEWRALLDINCLGVMNCMHIVMPGMKQRRHGTILNVSSIAGRKSYPYHDAYGASKAYVHALTEAARRSMASFDVRVIVVSPGLTQSEIETTMLNREAHEVWAARGADIGGGIKPENVARTMLFAYQMPQDVILQEIVITPTRQEF
ncbi:MAG TPA: SDR family oxidoreductase [Acidisoma sp.]|jgi:NADP-dependent 3-hydroxy acid dehydrogenase YdfG|uniref:SDR family oxidoreductase n=1 Tax=Acidisoma sp. TaxID=1872115 RepID=UPI002B6804AE|nr:SDR family oxidoreductase [Acidisoma sp.]HTI01766.1 SDR family oxidoreductase [Acidisoma sp.]